MNRFQYFSAILMLYYTSIYILLLQVMKMLMELGETPPTDLLSQQRLIFNYTKEYADGIRGMMEGNFELLPNVSILFWRFG